MPRVPQLTREDLAPEQRPIFDEIAGSRGEVRGPFPVLLNSPEAARRIAHLGAYLRFDSKLAPALRELAILTTARESDCQYEWAAHVPLAKRAGVRPEAIEAIRTRKAPEGLTSEEAAVVRYGQELLRRHRVSEEVFREVRERFGTQGATDLTALMGYYGMLACALNAFEVAPEPGAVSPLPV